MVTKTKTEIVDFILRRWKVDCDWLNGNCYYFALILRERFNFLSIYYLPIQGHFVAGAQNTYFDWTGEVTLNEEPILLSELVEKEPDWAMRLMRDCVF